MKYTAVYISAIIDNKLKLNEWENYKCNLIVN